MKQEMIAVRGPGSAGNGGYGVLTTVTPKSGGLLPDIPIPVAVAIQGEYCDQTPPIRRQTIPVDTSTASTPFGAAQAVSAAFDANLCSASPDTSCAHCAAICDPGAGTFDSDPTVTGGTSGRECPAATPVRRFHRIASRSSIDSVRIAGRIDQLTRTPTLRLACPRRTGRSTGSRTASRLIRTAFDVATVMTQLPNGTIEWAIVVRIVFISESLVVAVRGAVVVKEAEYVEQLSIRPRGTGSAGLGRTGTGRTFRRSRGRPAGRRYRKDASVSPSDLGRPLLIPFRDDETVRSGLREYWARQPCDVFPE